MKLQMSESRISRHRSDRIGVDTMFEVLLKWRRYTMETMRTTSSRKFGFGIQLGGKKGIGVWRILLCTAILVLVLGVRESFAQGVAIGESGNPTPNANAILDLQSASGTRGFLLPQLAAVPLANPNSTAKGLMFYNTAVHLVSYWNETNWLSLASLAGTETFTNKTLTTPIINGTIAGTTVFPVANGGTGVSTITGLVKGNGATAFSAGVAGTDYVLPGTLLNVQVLTASGTYTPAAGTKVAVVELWGGGGAGGSVTAVAGSAGGGGGSGGYAKYLLTNVSATYAYTIGAGGTAVAGAAGNAGGNTTFVNGATTVTAFGGGGGAFVAGSTAIKFTAGGAAAVISTNGTFNGSGAPGGNGMTSTVTTTNFSGFGASTSLGGGGNGVGGNVAATAIAGVAADPNSGSGGSGARTGTTTAALGGNGAAGVIIIHEYR